MSARQAIPKEALARRLAFVGTTGSGKTYTAKGGVERKLQAGERVVIIDPLDVWWGLRLSVDGKHPSPFEVVIFGGKHADMQITENGGKLLGEAVATAKESCIVSLGTLRTEAARRRFMVGFLDALYEHTDPEVSDPYTLVIDEADLFAPQKPFGGHAEMLLHLVEEIVRRGRVRGFLPWLISQRPAIVNKNVLSQVDGMVAMQLTGAHDRGAIEAWIEGHADKRETKELLASLAGLQQGNGILWVPRDAILRTMHFPENATFDSSRTPKRGEKKKAQKLKPLNLDKLKDKLASFEEEAKASDIPTLRKRIAELEAAQKKSPAAAAAPADPQKIAAAEQRGESRGYSRAAAEWHAKGFQAGWLAHDEACLDAYRTVSDAFGRADVKAGREAAAAIKQIISSIQSGPPAVKGNPVLAPRREPDSVPVPRKPPPAAAGGDGTLTSTMRETLRALAWWAAVGHKAPTKKQLAGMLGIVADGSTMRSRLAALSAPGLIEYPEPGRVSLTEAGAAVAPAPDMQASLVETIRASLTSTERATFDAIPADPNSSISREDLGAELGGIEPAGSTMRSRLANLSTREIIRYPSSGTVARQDWVVG